MLEHAHLRPAPEQLAKSLPAGFVIGTATAAAQIEGATSFGNRTPSVWDRFASQPGRILDGSDTSVTADHFHRYREDVALMADLGADAYRFSFSWTRLQPGGSGGRHCPYRHHQHPQPGDTRDRLTRRPHDGAAVRPRAQSCLR